MTSQSWSELFASVVARNIASSLLVIVLLLVARQLVVRSIARRSEQRAELARRWIVNSRNVMLVLIAFGLVLIWGPELRAFALSLAAFAVALVIASKELITNLTGAIYRATGRTFGIGDRIEVGGVRGDVVDQSLMSTTLLEVGPGHTSHRYTGRAVILPNSLLLSQPILSETYTEEYGFHVFTIPLAATDDWQRAERHILEAAEAECAPFLEQARLHLERVRRKHGLKAVRAIPRVSVRIPEPGRVELVVRVPVPVRESGKVEDAIIRGFLQRTARPPAEPAAS